MYSSNLDQILVTKLKRIPTLGGDVMHAMKSDDHGFNRFGEAYFSVVDTGAVKAWKKHFLMTLNLVVPVGRIKFVFHDVRCQSTFRVEEIGEDDYCRVTVPPGIWFGFQGISKNKNLVLNIADMKHDPSEVERLDPSVFNYQWRDL